MKMGQIVESKLMTKNHDDISNSENVAISDGKYLIGIDVRATRIDGQELISVSRVVLWPFEILAYSSL